MIVKYPIFKEVPKSGLANCNENIANFIKKGNKTLIKELLIPCDNGYKGYRFISSEDLTETIRTTQLIYGIYFEIIFIRHYHWKDHFCPLYFSELRTDIIMRAFPDKEYKWFYYQSDAHLKRLAKQYKS